MYSKLIRVVMLLIWNIRLMHYILHLTYELFVQNGSSNLGVYQFVNQEILFLLPHLYTLLCNQFVIWNMLNSLLCISLYSFCVHLELTSWQQTNKSYEGKLNLTLNRKISSSNYDTSVRKNFGSDTEFMNSRVPRIDHWGTPHFSVPQSQI